MSFFFFFNDTATTEIYTLSLHDALPIFFGLSFAFGAFVAGMVLSQSDYSHQALADVEPLRDVFTMLFFVSVGMLLEPAFLIENAGVVALVVLLVFVVKGLLFAGVVRAFGYGNIVPFAVGLGLFQIGEFSFVVARVGLDAGAISQRSYSVMLTRSEEHTSELQSRQYLVCRLLLEKKKQKHNGDWIDDGV